ncbi:MAG TPA: hypothetical protein G4O03_01460 [Dehalococcoidia bacterium]|nr:hypothetical protein [Dehalococcoidia bacterium]
MSPAHLELGVGDIAPVNVVVRNVTDLYAVDIHLFFDASLLEVQDANPVKSGIQIAPGTFLDPAQGYLFKNYADNDAGFVWFVITLLHPAPAVSGEGTLFTVNFQGQASGTSQLRLKAQLVGLTEGEVAPISAVTQGGTIVITP